MFKPSRNTKIGGGKPATDQWHVGVIHAPIARLLDADVLANAQVLWLPDPGNFRFIADPFGVHHDEKFTVFVEALDYRVKRGEIHYYTYDAAWNLADQGIALQMPFHLSYPTIIRDGDEIYMLPEAHKSGKLTLYRAVHFPDRWEPVADLLNLPAIDASVIQYQNRWWMFYALPGANNRALREMHVAYAETLMGPWIPHAENPVRDALDSARPGGLPFVHEGTLYLPTQDCVSDYGAAVNLLRIERLTPENFAATVVSHLSPKNLPSGYRDGLHTLSGEGAVTLIDVKRIQFSYWRYCINFERRVRRWLCMKNIRR